ncbi:MAG: thermonuclease family protein [Helicobacteraceae bacterium]|jgi:micrococcal nuclease|nr:thermonuclease family protein [Helicobacteraceae bacterium]
MTIAKNRLFLTILVTSIFSVTLYAEAISNKNYGSVVVTEVTSIYDGDTFRANIQEYPEVVGYHIGIRINGIDTPEMRGKCLKEKRLAQKAKQFSVEKLRNAKKIELRNMKRGKYFRIVADVYVDEKSLGSMLTDQGLAVVYDGGHKAKDWCQ